LQCFKSNFRQRRTKVGARRYHN